MADKEQTGSTLPLHVAFIMDGNGRWAKKRMLPRSSGHKEGVRVLERIAKHCMSCGVRYVTVYAFSTENMNRPRDEVESLFKMFCDYIDRALEDSDPERPGIRVIGDISVLGEKYEKKIKMLEANGESRKFKLIIAFNYGARAEIARALSIALEKGLQSVSENDVQRLLYTTDIPDPDLIIRTGGDERLSNFLLWQAAYSELYFTPVLWPDLSERDVDAALESFAGRKRNFGKRPDES